MTRLKWNLILVRLEIVLASVQDRCAVCAKLTIGSEIIFDAHDGTPRRKIGAWFTLIVSYAWKSFGTHPIEFLGDVGHVESDLGPFGDSVSVCAR